MQGGLDLEDANDAGHTVFGGIPDAVAQGLLPEAFVDRSVSRLVYVRMRTGEFDDPSLQPYRQIPFEQIRTAAHLALSREVATKSLVLLENRDWPDLGGQATLPLQSPAPAAGQAQGRKLSFAAVGPFSDCQACYFGKYSPRQDFTKTVTVAGGLVAAGHAVRVAGGCGRSKQGLDAGNYGGPGGCGCVSCPCPAGGGPEPYMCETCVPACLPACSLARASRVPTHAPRAAPRAHRAPRLCGHRAPRLSLRSRAPSLRCPHRVLESTAPAR